MKLLLITPEFDANRGGVGRYLRDLYSALPGESVRVVHDVNIWKPHWLATVWKMWRELRTYPRAVLHVSHLLPLGTSALILHWLTGRKYIVSLHGMDFFMAQEKSRKRFLARIILKSAALVTANSQALANEVARFSGRAVAVIYPACTAPPPKILVSAGEGLRLFSMSRLVRRKGIDLVIRALAHLPVATLAIGGDGPARSSLEELVSSLGLEARVEFLSWLDDEAKAREFRKAHLFVLPTRDEGADREGFGIVYLEAQMNGVPVIAGKGIGVEEALHPCLRLHARAHTPETLVESIQTLIKADFSRRELQRYAMRFDARKHAERFWKLVRALRHSN